VVLSTKTRQSKKFAFRTRDRRRLLDVRRRDDYEAAYAEPEPLVSVYIPTFERAELILSRTLPSVYGQDYENWEVVIIGDCMEDRQADLLRKISDRRVYFHNLRKRGNYPSSPLAHWYTAGMKPANFALRLVRGHWITPLDDDDEFTPTHISSLLGLAREKHVEWAHGQVIIKGRSCDPDLVLGQLEPKMGGIANVSSLYHGALKSFRYNPNCWRYDYPADWDLWERFLHAGVSHEHLDDVVSICHCRPATYRALAGRAGA
jgi:glycosyltransferase involved in cell wall biosynthesis